MLIWTALFHAVSWLDLVPECGSAAYTFVLEIGGRGSVSLGHTFLIALDHWKLCKPIKALACIVSINIPVTKANHIVILNINGPGKYTLSTGTEGVAWIIIIRCISDTALQNSEAVRRTLLFFFMSLNLYVRINIYARCVCMRACIFVLAACTWLVQ